MSMFYELMMKKKGMPSRYQEVEYIENIAEEYGAFINTGYKANNNTRLVVKCSLNTSAFSATGGHQLAGSDNQSTTMFGVGTATASQNYRFQYGSQNTTIGTMVADTPTIFDLNKNKCYIDNNLVHTFTEETFNCLQNTLLFHRALNSQWSYWVGKIYYCQIYDNDRLVRNFIPVYDTLTNKYGMWETMQGKFYGNAGTGDFKGSIVGYTVVGSPTITDGVVSGFSSSDYLMTSSNYTTNNMNNDDYEFCIKLTPTSSMGSECYAIKYYNNSTVRGIGIHSNKFIWSVGQPNTTGHQASIVSSFNVTTNTTYWLKGIYKNKIASLYYSLDGTNYTLIESIDETDQTFKITSAFNFGATAGSSYGLFLGSIDMKETYIKINNKLWFNGQQA